MTLIQRFRQHRQKVIPILFIGATVSLALWFREPLRNWFTMSEPASASTTQPATDTANLSAATVAESSARPATQPATRPATQPATRPSSVKATVSHGLEEPTGPISHEGHGHLGSDPAQYTCSMHPSVRQQEPGTCPICSMDLTPVTWDEKEGGVIFVDPTRRQEFGVRTGRVVRQSVRRQLRAVGRVTYDETRMEDVTLKFDGWIVRLLVNATGQAVQKGQPLFTFYSPELHAAQQEFLLALRSRAAATAEGSTRADYLVEAARERFRLWDLTDEQIDSIAQSDKPLRAIRILSPASGHVIEKEIVEGASVKAGQRLYRIANLNRVWIEADIYESDLADVAIGQEATITLPYLSGTELRGQVAHLYPFLDAGARTGRIRIELPNPGLALRPDMYANVDLHLDLGERLLVPQSAVLYTGPRRLVFLDLGEGRLRPQEVKLGVRSDGHYQVLEGLREGQRVVTSGNFLVAAESRIRSATTFWGSSDDDQ